MKYKVFENPDSLYYLLIDVTVHFYITIIIVQIQRIQVIFPFSNIEH